MIFINLILQPQKMYSLNFTYKTLLYHMRKEYSDCIYNLLAVSKETAYIMSEVLNKIAAMQLEWRQHLTQQVPDTAIRL